MKAGVIVIDKETDGAITISCDLSLVNNRLQIDYDDHRGWAMQIPLETLQLVIEDNLHD